MKVGAFLTRKDIRGRSLCVRNSVRSRSFRGNASVFFLFSFLLMRSYQFVVGQLCYVVYIMCLFCVSRAAYSIFVALNLFYKM